MKLIISFATLASFLAMPSILRAQSENGTWKLDTAKSKYTGVAAPKSRTQTWESDGSGGVKHHVEGTAGDGSAINYSFSGKFDSKDHAISGSGAPGAANSVALKRIDANTMEVNYKKDGKTVTSARSSVSRDGKIMTTTANGTNSDGTKTNVRAVYEKQ